MPVTITFTGDNAAQVADDLKAFVAALTPYQTVATYRIETEAAEETMPTVDEPLGGIDREASPHWQNNTDETEAPPVPEAEVVDFPEQQKRRGRPPKAKPADIEAVAEPAPVEPTPEPEAARAPDAAETTLSSIDALTAPEKPVDIVTVRERLRMLLAKHGGGLTACNLMFLGFKRPDGEPAMAISQLQPADYPAFLARIERALPLTKIEDVEALVQKELQ